ncbi:MAG: hypothetical protein K2X47_11880 [Bdellovibrionales bacterium]|nr:hypothetical protein [Bdellovibrionales bacterium]
MKLFLFAMISGLVFAQSLFAGPSDRNGYKDYVCVGTRMTNGLNQTIFKTKVPIKYRRFSEDSAQRITVEPNGAIYEDISDDRIPSKFRRPEIREGIVFFIYGQPPIDRMTSNKDNFVPMIAIKEMKVGVGFIDFSEAVGTTDEFVKIEFNDLKVQCSRLK